MKHVTDERTDRPLDRGLNDWLERSIQDLPDGGELPSSIRSHVLSRLPGTPQRRRWWPLRWFPFGLGATRSADAEEPRPEGRIKSMFTAERVAAGVAILSLAGSLALVAGPTVLAPLVPAAEQRIIDPADFGGFTGVMRCSMGMDGTTSSTGWGSLTKGETYPRCTIEVSDPRINGNNYSVHDYYRYDRRPQWGVRSVSNVITNDGGSWVSTRNWGYHQPHDGTMFYAAELRGTGAYEGLSALMVLSQDTWGLSFDVEGVIIPGEMPEAPELPLEEALAKQAELAAD
jgi:hypothetical protein